MAGEEHSNGVESKLKQMAQMSINKQQQEINKLESFANNSKPTVGDSAATRKMMQPMEDMLESMDHQSMMAGSTDQNFA